MNFENNIFILLGETKNIEFSIKNDNDTTDGQPNPDWKKKYF